jgi:NAD+ synthase (glutamine-hydrolysing)
MRIALAQINPTVGDLEGNARAITAAIERSAGADLVVLPELCVCGYPPRDLLLHGHFVEACGRVAAELGAAAPVDQTLVIGVPLRRADGRLSNALVVYRGGMEIARYAKRLLPTYDVFDEDRYFEAGDEPVVIDVAGVRVGLSVCEDLWRGEDAGFAHQHAVDVDPVAGLAAAGARVIVNPSASPFVVGKRARHLELLRGHATRHGVHVVSVNQVGGNDDLVFDGRSCVIGPSGAVLARAAAFAEDVVVTEVASNGRADVVGRPTGEVEPGPRESDESAEEMVWKALVLGVRDYVHKTGFRSVIIGLSGGIDSALTAAIAAAALGPGQVLGVSMPGKYSSDHSRSDAAELADRLGVRMLTAPIAGPFDGFRSVLDAVFGELGERALGESLPDLTEENLQSRVRGAVVMAMSNRTGSLVLTTGNKSEFAVGYCTLYGDMNGGLAVLSDVPKTLVYRVSRWVNERFADAGFARPPIPQGTIDKPPSAELAPGQEDSDSLPAYEVLDRIIDLYVERRLSVADVITMIETEFGASHRVSPDETRRVCRLIDLNEYKRRQAAVGVKVTHVAFGPGRRMPIARGPWRG